jgi:hypothetical protein
MPQVIVCQCGQRFEAADSLAGTIVGCPVCGKALAIPRAPRPALAPLRPLAPQADSEGNRAIWWGLGGLAVAVVLALGVLQIVSQWPQAEPANEAVAAGPSAPLPIEPAAPQLAPPPPRPPAVPTGVILSQPNPPPVEPTFLPEPGLTAPAPALDPVPAATPPSDPAPAAVSLPTATDLVKIESEPVEAFVAPRLASNWKIEGDYIASPSQILLSPQRKLLWRGRKVYDVATAKEQWTLPEEAHGGAHKHLSDDGSFALIADDSTVTPVGCSIYYRSGKRHRFAQPGKLLRFDIKLLAGGRVLTIESKFLEQHTLRVYDAKSLERISEFQVPWEPHVCAWAVHPDGRSLAVFHADRLTLRRLPDGALGADQPLAPYNLASWSDCGLAYSTTGDRLALVFLIEGGSILQLRSPTTGELLADHVCGVPVKALDGDQGLQCVGERGWLVNTWFERDIISNEGANLWEFRSVEAVRIVLALDENRLLVAQGGKRLIPYTIPWAQIERSKTPVRGTIPLAPR